MYFVCVYCKKETNEIVIMVDKKHFVHLGCENDFNKERLTNNLEDILNDKENVSDELECCK